MSIRNKVQLIGNVGQDPVVRTTENGSKFATCSLATNETYTKKQTGEKVTETQWHNLVFNNKNADIVEQYVTKGKQIAVEGKLKTRKFTGKDGIVRYATEIMVTEIVLLGSAPEQKQEEETAGEIAE